MRQAIEERRKQGKRMAMNVQDGTERIKRNGMDRLNITITKQTRNMQCQTRQVLEYQQTTKYTHTSHLFLYNRSSSFYCGKRYIHWEDSHLHFLRKLTTYLHTYTQHQHARHTQTDTRKNKWTQDNNITSIIAYTRTKREKENGKNKASAVWTTQTQHNQKTPTHQHTHI